MPFASQWFANTGAPAYEIEQSCRFNDNDSATLTRTPGSAGNRRTWTLSVWIKRGNITGADKNFFNAGPSGSGSDQETELKFYDGGEGVDAATLRFYDYGAGAYNFDIGTTQVWRDPNSWFHFVVKVDTTQSTDTDRVVIYSNNEVVPIIDGPAHTGNTYPALNLETAICDDVAHIIGKYSGASIQYFDGYLAELHFIDGSALTPSSFAETNSTTGQWVPIEYTGSYGTTGCYLAFQDSSALGDDTSGNGNDWTSSGLAAVDQVPDSPTDNYCTFNPLDRRIPTYDYVVLSNGNLDVTQSNATGVSWVGGSVPAASGKWYWETTVGAGGTLHVGILATAKSLSDGTIQMPGDNTQGWVYRSDGQKENGSTMSSYGDTFTTGDVISVAWDADIGAIWFAKDGTWQASATEAEIEAGTTTNAAFSSGIAGIECRPVTAEDQGSGVHSWVGNFGQHSFTGSMPSGFSHLSTANLGNPATADPSAYFQTTLYTGNGSTQSVDQSENKSFEPDLVWIKNRDATDSNILTDSVRGVTKVISSDATAAETTDADTLTAFESNGFALGDDDKVNTNTEKYVAWQWLESSTPGFDIVSFTGNATNRTISHSLGVIPEMIFVKNLADTDNWAVYHAGNTAAPATDYLILNTNSTTTDDATIWNDTAPTSSVFSVGTSALTNGNTEAMIAYLWAGVEGFSKIGKYVGTGTADGPFITCGFRPDWVMIKEADTSARDWIIQDAVRNPYNVANLQLLANSNAAEATTFYSQSAEIDIVSNGFKVRSGTVRVSENAATYVYAAFAHAPFKSANAR